MALVDDAERTVTEIGRRVGEDHPYAVEGRYSLELAYQSVGRSGERATEET